jgi:hypothetical protein
MIGVEGHLTIPGFAEHTEHRTRHPRQIPNSLKILKSTALQSFLDCRFDFCIYCQPQKATCKASRQLRKGQNLDAALIGLLLASDAFQKLARLA